jgi:hypothetical protein
MLVRTCARSPAKGDPTPIFTRSTNGLGRLTAAMASVEGRATVGSWTLHEPFGKVRAQSWRGTSTLGGSNPRATSFFSLSRCSTVLDGEHSSAPYDDGSPVASAAAACGAAPRARATKPTHASSIGLIG